MWLLTCDNDDLFGGKPLWLRPGTTHLFGRTTQKTENGERTSYIEHRSVSRKHLTFKIGENKAGDSSKLHVRSEIEITESSKIGTTFNGELVKAETKKLDGKSYTIKLGSYEHLFHLEWTPIVLTFTGISKKAKSDPLAARREQLKQTDIKLISDYVSNETTHVVAKKRNNPPALQALIQARWVVTDAFVEELARVVAVDKNKSSLLEDDFASWPNEEGFLVPAASEPQPRPDSYLKPNRDRKEVFQDFIFVFLSQHQHDTLLPVITAGGGKALLRDAESPGSTVQDVVEYIKEAAAHKGSGQFRLSQQPGSGGIVVVRLNGGDENLKGFGRSVDLALDQRSIEQNEFLDAILTLDTSSLRRALPEEDDPAVNGSREVQTSQSASQTREQRAITITDSPPPQHDPRRDPQQSGHPPPSQNQPQRMDQDQEPEQPSTAATTRRRNRRIITQSRFKGFDDDFDPSEFSKPAEDSPATFGDASQASSSRHMDIDGDSQASRTQQGSRKRPAPEEDAEQDEEDMYAAILTGHAAMKRQKTLAGQSGIPSNSKSPNESNTAASITTANPKKKVKEMDIMAELQARRERQEEQRRLDEEALQQTLEPGEDPKAVVEEMDIPIRERPTRNSATEEGASERWDSSWNGRKNFKGFRRQGERRDGPRLQRVMVPLEEVPRKRDGIGDEYWLNSSSTNRSKSKSQSQSQNMNIRHPQRTTNNEVEEVEDDGNEEDEETRFRRRLQRVHEDELAQAAREVINPEDIAGRPRDEQIAEAMKANRWNATPSQTLGTESQRKAAGKRPAGEQIVAGIAAPPAKKARQTQLGTTSRAATRTNADEDDDDGLKFRRRGGRR